jgi:copper ion binding protein
MNNQHTPNTILTSGMLTGVDSIIETDDRIKTITIPIGGLSCASCVNRAERGLVEITGVVDAKVNLATEQATIDFKESRVTLITMLQAIQELGYQTDMATLTIPVEDMTCASCVNKVQKTLKETEGVISATVTLLTLIMFPILVVVYVRLAKREEKVVREEFGEVYEAYTHDIPSFIPIWTT